MRAHLLAAVVFALTFAGIPTLAAPDAHPLHVTRVSDALRLCGPRPRNPGRYRCVAVHEGHDIERIKYAYQKIGEGSAHGGKTATDDWLAP